MPGMAVMIRVLLADDQEMVRAGFGLLLSAEDDIDVVGEAAHGEEAVTLTGLRQPDVVLMDLQMPILDGLEATRRIVAEYPDVKVLILTTFERDHDISRFHRARSTHPRNPHRVREALRHGDRCLADGVYDAGGEDLIAQQAPFDGMEHGLASARRLRCHKACEDQGFPWEQA